MAGVVTAAGEHTESSRAGTRIAIIASTLGGALIYAFACHPVVVGDFNREFRFDLRFAAVVLGLVVFSVLIWWLTQRASLPVPVRIALVALTLPALLFAWWAIALRPVHEQLELSEAAFAEEMSNFSDRYGRPFATERRGDQIDMCARDRWGSVEIHCRVIDQAKPAADRVVGGFKYDAPGRGIEQPYECYEEAFQCD